MSLRSKRVSVLAGLGAVGALWFAVGADEAEPPAREPSPVASRTAIESHAAPADASSEGDARPDGDATTDGEEVDPKAAEVLRQWRAALAPVLDGAGDAGETSPPLPPSAHVSPGPARVTKGPARPDADVPREEACRPGTVLLPIGFAMLDMVVAIDVSGSMRLHGTTVHRWLTSLEPMLRQEGIDYRLHMLVDERRLGLLRMPYERGPSWTPSDAGTHLNLAIESHDVLDVLTAPPRAGTSWVSSLRPNAAVHVVIVTDDDPTPESASHFVERLTGFAGGRLGTLDAPTFGFHALLGMRAGDARALSADAPLEERHCAMAEAAGLEYQRLVRQLGGVRASVCDAKSVEAFTQRLIAQVTSAIAPADGCRARLPPGVAAQAITSVRALSRDGSASRQLRLAFDSWNCSEGDAYELLGTTLRVCPNTCRAYQGAGFALEVTYRCEP